MNLLEPNFAYESFKIKKVNKKTIFTIADLLLQGQKKETNTCFDRSLKTDLVFLPTTFLFTNVSNGGLGQHYHPASVVASAMAQPGANLMRHS